MLLTELETDVEKLVATRISRYKYPNIKEFRLEIGSKLVDCKINMLSTTEPIICKLATKYLPDIHELEAAKNQKLLEILREQHVSPDDRIQVARSIGEALRKANDSGVFLCDVAPRNIVLKRESDGKINPYFVDMERTLFFPRPLTNTERKAQLGELRRRSDEEKLTKHVSIKEYKEFLDAYSAN